MSRRPFPILFLAAVLLLAAAPACLAQIGSRPEAVRMILGKPENEVVPLEPAETAFRYVEEGLYLIVGYDDSGHAVYVIAKDSRRGTISDEDIRFILGLNSLRGETAVQSWTQVDDEGRVHVWKRRDGGAVAVHDRGSRTFYVYTPEFRRDHDRLNPPEDATRTIERLYKPDNRMLRSPLGW